ncbi:protein of unknown function [Aminobacter niigataensis]|nr:protein of unknown function [Aminobacter niigataensis]
MRKFPRRGCPSADLFQCKLERIEFGFERRIDLARAHLHDQAAEQRRIYGDRDRHILAGDAFQRCLEFRFLGCRQRMRRGHFSRGLATMLGSDLAERLDHAGQGEKAAIARHEAKEVASQAGDLGLVGDRRDSLFLVFAGEDRALDQAVEIGAAIKQSGETTKVGFYLCNGACFEREIEQRSSITLSNTGDWRGRLGHGPSFLLSDRPQDCWRERLTLAKSLTLLRFLTPELAAAASPRPKVDCRLAQAFEDRNTSSNSHFRHYCRILGIEAAAGRRFTARSRKQTPGVGPPDPVR